MEAARKDDADPARGSGLPALQSLPSAAGATARPVHSEKLMRRLTAHRVAAIQAELLDRPELALAALTTHLTLKLLADPLHGAYRLPNLLAISATGNQHELRGAAEDIEASPAAQRIEADRIAWIEHLPEGTRRGVRLDAAAAAADGAAAADLPGRVHRERHHRHRRRPTGQ